METVILKRSALLPFVIILIACSLQSGPETRPDVTGSYETTPTIPLPTLTIAPTRPIIVQSPAIVGTPTSSLNGLIGTGLRQQTVEILLKFADCAGFTMAASSELAETYFPQLEGWMRVLGAPSLQVLQEKAERARINSVSYEALAYGLETSKSTPEEEWRNMIDSVYTASNLAEEYEKLLVMGPGFQLMSQNEDNYAPMASEAEIWMLQTQQLQKDPPGPAYREEVERIVNLIRFGNPKVQVWAQITLPPDREPNAEEWLEYRQLIADLVEGTYVGVYTWDTANNDQLVATIESIFETVCSGNSLR